MSTLEIGGKKFSLVDLERRTVRQDHYMVAVFRRTGIDKVTPVLQEDPKEFLLRLHQKLLASGLACEILSAFILPEGTTNKQWRPTTAKDVQTHLEDCDTEIDRQLINQLAFEVMTGFFKQGLLSLLNSLRHSTTGQNESPMQSSPRIEESSEKKLEPGQPSSELFRSSTTTAH
jgi:hypothetical protein